MTSSVKNAHEVSMKIYYFSTALFAIIDWGRIILSITVCNIYVCVSINVYAYIMRVLP